MTRNSKVVVSAGLMTVFVTVLGSCHSFSRSAESASRASPAPTKKWEFSTGHPALLCRGCYYEEQIPAIGSDGTIYAGGSRGLYALHPDGTYARMYWPNRSVEHSKIPLNEPRALSRHVANSPRTAVRFADPAFASS